MTAGRDAELDDAIEATPAGGVSDDEAPTTFASFLGPLKDKKRKLIQSRAEYLRENLSLVDSSSRILGLSGGAVSSDSDNHQPGGPELVSVTSSSTVSEHSTVQLRSSTPSTTLSPHASGTVSQHAGHYTQKADKPTLEGMHIYDREIDDETYSRFYEICEQLEPALITFLHKKRVQFRPFGIQVLVLGHTEEVARPWIVVRCGKDARKKARSFLKKDFVKNLCQGPPKSCRARFEVIVTSPVQMKHGETPDPDMVLIQQEELKQSEVWTPRIKVIQSGFARYATIGGFVCVTDHSGSKSFYGLTAGHVLPPNNYEEPSSGSSSDDSESDSEAEDADDDIDAYHGSDEGLSNARSSAPSRNSCDLGEQSLQETDDARDKLTPVTLGAMCKVSYSLRARNHDWALVDITEKHKERLYVSTAANDRLMDVARPTYGRRFVTRDKSRWECMLSPLPARMLLPSGHKFVDVNVLHITNGAVLPRGSSGTWIIDADERVPTKVYGTLVGTDSLKTLWMVPMNAIVEDIQFELNAFHIELSNGGRNIDNDDILESSDSEDYLSPRGKSFVRQLKEKQRLYDAPKLIGEIAPIQPLPASKSSIKVTQHDDKLEFTSDGQPTGIYNEPKPVPGGSTYLSSTTRKGPRHDYEESWYGRKWSKTKSSTPLLWHCGECGDGPYADWQFSCQNCGYNDRA